MEDTCVGCLSDTHKNQIKTTRISKDKILKRFFQNKKELFEPYLERKSGNSSIGIYKKIILIPQGKSLFGNKSVFRDFHIYGPEVEENHCFLIREGYTVTLSPIATSTFVDEHRVIKAVKLENNVLLRFGKSNVFRIRLPQFHVNQWNTPGYLTRSDIKEIRQKNFILTKNKNLKGCCNDITGLECSPSICEEFLKVICRDQQFCCSDVKSGFDCKDSVHLKKHTFHYKESKFDDLKNFILTQAKKRLSSSKGFRNVDHTSGSINFKNYSPTNSINVSECYKLVHKFSFDVRSYSDSVLFIHKHSKKQVEGPSLTSRFLFDPKTKFKKLERKFDDFFDNSIKIRSSYHLPRLNTTPQQDSFVYKHLQRSFITKLLSMDDRDLENLSSSESDLKSLYERQKTERLKEQQRAVEEEKRLNELMDMLNCDSLLTHGTKHPQSTPNRLDGCRSPTADSGVGFCSPDYSQMSSENPHKTASVSHRSSSEDRQFLPPYKCNLNGTLSSKQFLIGASLLDNRKSNSDSKIWNETDHEIQSFYDLQKDVMQNISDIKNEYFEIEAQHKEIQRELEVEKALIEGEQELLLTRLKDAQHKMADIERKDLIDGLLVQKDVSWDEDVVKSERIKLKDFETKRKFLEMKLLKDGCETFSKKFEEARELEDNQRCLMENLEFQLLEGESKLEDEKETNLLQLREEKDVVIKSCRMFQENLDQIAAQKTDLNIQIELELAEIEKNKQNLNKQMQKEYSTLMKINQQIEIIESNKANKISNFPKRVFNYCTEGSTGHLSSRILPRYNSNNLDVKMFHGNKYRKPPPLVPAFSSPHKADLFHKASSWLTIASSDNSEDDSSIMSGSDNNNPDRALREEHKIEDMECQLILAKAEKMKIIEKKKFLEEELTLDEERKNVINEKKNNSNKLIISLQADQSYLHIPAADHSIIDLLMFIQTRGHDVDECHDLILTPSFCRGFLTKMTGSLGGHLRTWKKRWFLFDKKKRCLSYYYDRKEDKPRNVMYFQSIQNVFVDHLHQVSSPTPQLTFCIKTFERTFYLVAPTSSALRIWVDVILTGAEGCQAS